MSKCLLLLSFLGMGQTALASNSSVKKAPKASKDWSISVRNTTTSNLHKLDSVNHYATNTTSLSASVKTGKARVSLSTSLVKELQGERDQNLSDFGLSLSRPLGKFGDYTSVSNTFSLKLPTSKNSDERASLQFQATYAPTISISGGIVGSKNIGFSISPYFILPKHEYKTTTTGSSNNQFITGSSFSVGYSLTDDLSIGTSFSYTRTFKYGGEQRDFYENSFYIGYSITKTTSASLSYSIGGSPLAPNGKDTEIKFIDNDEATLSLGLSTRF